MTQDGYVDMETVKQRKKSAIGKKNDENYENDDNYEEPLPGTKVNKMDQEKRPRAPTDVIYEEANMRDVPLDTPDHHHSNPPSQPVRLLHPEFKKIFITIAVLGVLCVVTFAIAIAGLAIAINKPVSEDKTTTATTTTSQIHLNSTQTGNLEYARILKMTGWYKANNGHWYKMSSLAFNYNTALAFCGLQDARLASGVKNAAILDELSSFILTPIRKDAWIGLQKGSTGWKWSDGANFVNGQTGAWLPTMNTSGCAILRSSGRTDFTSTDCTQGNHYLCETKTPIY